MAHCQVAYLRGWQLSLVMTAALPAMSLSAFLYTWSMQNMSRLSKEAYQKAGSRAEQAITCIKNIKSLNGQLFEDKVFSEYLLESFRKSVKFGIIEGIGFGFMMCMM